MKKIAIVYDWIDKYGGAERILDLVFAAFPEADIYTLYTDFKRAQWAKKYKERIKTTELEKIFRIIPFKQLLVPFMPAAIESFDLSKYDRVLSFSSSFAKGVLTRPETTHLSYIFCPTRFLWHQKALFFSNFWLFRPFLTILRQWDFIAAKRPDKIFTLSKYSQRLIKKYYQRNSEILWPPFDVGYWQKLLLVRPKIKLAKDYFLLVSRLEAQKQTDLAISVFKNQKNKQLVVVGSGSKERYLKSISPKNIVFVKNLTDNNLAWLYKNAKALIMPQSEDFGYTALESLAFKTPVVAYCKSGTAEIIEHGKTGFLFAKQTEQCLSDALENYKGKAYNFSQLNWSKFRKSVFIEKLKKNISY